MAWQWWVVIWSFIIIPVAVSYYIKRLYRKETGREIPYGIVGEIFALMILMLWIALFIGHCSVSW